MLTYVKQQASSFLDQSGIWSYTMLYLGAIIVSGTSFVGSNGSVLPLMINGVVVPALMHVLDVFTFDENIAQTFTSSSNLSKFLQFNLLSWFALNAAASICSTFDFSNTALSSIESSLFLKGATTISGLFIFCSIRKAYQDYNELKLTEKLYWQGPRDNEAKTSAFYER
jgi:hypothetical protein